MFLPGVFQIILIFAFLAIVQMFVSFGTMGNPERGKEIMEPIITWVFLIGFGPWILYYGAKILKGLFSSGGAGREARAENDGYGPFTGLKFDIEEAIEVIQKANHLNALGALSNDAVARILNGLKRSEIARGRTLTEGEGIPPIQQLDPYYSISAIETIASSKLLKAGEAELARHVVMSRLEGKEPIEVPLEPSNKSSSDMRGDEEVEYHGVIIRKKKDGPWFIGEKKFLTLGKAKAYIQKHQPAYSY